MTAIHLSEASVYI